MTVPLTATLLGVCLILTVAFGYLGARPARPGRVRLAPWRFLMVLAFTGLVALAVHLASLARGDARQEPAPNTFMSR